MPHVTLDGDLHGEYVITQQHPDGTLVLEPDTSARAICAAWTPGPPPPKSSTPGPPNTGRCSPRRRRLGRLSPVRARPHLLSRDRDCGLVPSSGPRRRLRETVAGQSAGEQAVEQRRCAVVVADGQHVPFAAIAIPKNQRRHV
jgi:hypothetical protein